MSRHLGGQAHTLLHEKSSSCGLTTKIQILLILKGQKNAVPFWLLHDPLPLLLSP